MIRRSQIPAARRPSLSSLSPTSTLETSLSKCAAMAWPKAPLSQAKIARSSMPGQQTPQLGIPFAHSPKPHTAICARFAAKAFSSAIRTVPGPSASLTLTLPLTNAGTSSRSLASSGQKNFAIWDCTLLQKLRRLPQKQLQLAVMHPASRPLHRDQAASANRLHPRIVFRNRRKALRAPEEQRGRGNLAIELRALLHVEDERREGAHIVVELPYQ